MICTQSGKIILAETKGGHLKIALGSAWAKAAGSQYRYFMVFKDSDAPLEGAMTMSRFLSILQEL